MTDERDLIARCRRGDQRAFESLVLRKRDKALRIAFNIVGDEDDAKDIVQQAFIRVWSLFDSFDEASRFDPWFHRIVVNLAIDHYRREHKRMNVSLSSGGLESEAVPPAMWSRQGADERLLRDELRRVFNRVAADLGPIQRAVFTLKEIEGATTKEVVAIMGIRASTVRNHLMQARRTLRDGLRRYYPEYFSGGSR